MHLLFPTLHRVTITLGAVALGALGLSSAVQARDVVWSVGISSPGVQIGVANAAPVIVAPAPMYYHAAPPVYAPPQVVYGAPQVVYGQPPVVYGPPPVVYGPPPVVYGTPRVVYVQPPVIYAPPRHVGRAQYWGPPPPRQGWGGPRHPGHGPRNGWGR